MGGVRFLAATVLVLALGPFVAAAQSVRAPEVENEEISVDADQISYNKRDNTMLARGNVVITRGDTELRADEVVLNRTTNEADASGNVHVTGPEGSLVADQMHLNLDDETGVLTGAEIQSQRLRYSIWGQRVEKGLGQSYHIENGRFTTCRCTDGPPSWSISGEDLQVTLGGYGKLRAGTFNVLDVPIAYLPSALFPVQRDRQSGLLLPRFGASNTRGFQTLLPVYWAISKSQDLTTAVDVETSARVGLVSEYRYMLSREVRGVLDGSYFNESFRGGHAGNATEPTIPQNRWSVLEDHRQEVGAGAKAYADVFLVGDDLFLREINTYAFDHSREVGIRTLPFTRSRAGLVQDWDRVAIRGEGTYYQNLTGYDSKTLQRAPEISLLGQRQLGDHLLGDLTIDGVDFQRGSSADGLRLDFEPGLTLPLSVGHWAFGSIRTSARETVYHLTEPTLMQSGTTRMLREDQSRELMRVDASLGTMLDRVYQTEWLGLERVKHTLEPSISYLYIPAVGQGELPFFDSTDRVNQRNLLTYGIVSRFIGKFAKAQSSDDDEEEDGEQQGPDDTIRELGRLSLMQSYDVTREIDPLQPGRTPEHLSDVDFGGRVNPSRSLSVRFNTNYDTTTNNISAAKVGFFIEDPRYHPSGDADAPRLETRTSAGVSYRVLTGNFLQELDTNIIVAVTDWAGLLYSTRYDVVTNRFLDNHFGLRLVSTCDCWALDFGVTDRTNPQEVEVRAQMTLVGLGSSSRGRRRVAAIP